jgi:hypothetical protein
MLPSNPEPRDRGCRHVCQGTDQRYPNCHWSGNFLVTRAISAARQSPALLRQLTRAFAASNEKRAVALCKSGGSDRAPTRRQDIKTKPANWAGIPPENLQRVDLLQSSPAGTGRAPLLLRRKKLLRTTRSRREQLTPRWQSGELLCRKLGRLRRRTWSRTRPTLLPPRRQLIGACLNTWQCL